MTLLVFEANQYMGPTLAATLSSTAPLFAITDAVLFLDEPLTQEGGLGTVGIVIGIILLTWDSGGRRRDWPKLALLLPLGAACIRGAAQTTTKFGLAILPDPFVAGLVGYTMSALSVWIVVRLRYGANRPAIKPQGVKWFMLVGLSNGTAVLALYMGLNMGKVVVVAPIAATFPLVTLLLSLMFYRRESFSSRLLVGIALVVASVILITSG